MFLFSSDMRIFQGKIFPHINILDAGRIPIEVLNEKKQKQKNVAK